MLGKSGLIFLSFVIILNSLMVPALAISDHETAGISLGAFLFYPELTFQETYTDNVFLMETDEIEDYLSYINVGSDVSMNLGRHLLHGGYLASIRRANTEEVMDKTHQYANLGLFFKLKSGVNLQVTDDFADDSVDPWFVGDKRDDYRTNLAGAMVDYTMKNAYRIKFGYSNQVKRFYGEASETDNFTRSIIPAGFYYKVGSNSWLLGEYSLKLTDQELDFKDNNLHLALAGWEFEVTDKITATFKTGFISIDYDQGDSFGTAPGFIILKYQPFSYSLLTLDFSRTIIETTIAEENAINGNFYTSTQAKLSLRHQFSMKTAAKISAFAAMDRFPVIENFDKREDDSYGFGGTLEYMLREYFLIELNYQYKANDSNYDIDDFIDNSVFIKTGFRF